MDQDIPPPSEAATVAEQPRHTMMVGVDELDVQQATDVILDAGRPLTFGGVIEYIRQHGDYIDGARLGRMVSAGRLLRCDKNGRPVHDGRYLIPPEMADAA